MTEDSNMPVNPEMTITVTITMADSTTFTESSGIPVTLSEERLNQAVSDAGSAVIADYLGA